MTYSEAAEEYAEAGWLGILPLPHGTKYPPPTGFTGRVDRWPTIAEIERWHIEYEDGNLGLRLPADVIGIDCDGYGEKLGFQTMRERVQQWGPLPPTTRSTSRDDGSGIYLFRIPEGLAWPGEVGPGVEIVQMAHRYAVAWPSIHPEGRQYNWLTGKNTQAGIPNPEDLPELPAAWVAGLTGGLLDAGRVKAELTDDGISQWLRRNGDGAMCPDMRNAVERGVLRITAGGSRHEATRDLSTLLCCLAAEGHGGLIKALNRVGIAFAAAAGNERVNGGEWARLWQGAVLYAVGKFPTPATLDPCAERASLDAPTSTRGDQMAASMSEPPIVDADALEPSDAAAREREERIAVEMDKMTVREEALKRVARARNDKEEWVKHVQTGAVIFDTPVGIPHIWGSGETGIWAEGEATVLAGLPGTGKSTLVFQVVERLLGLNGASLLGHPIAPASGRVLYLAMDRPRQLVRLMQRALLDHDRGIVEEKLRIWPGPPPGSNLTGDELRLTEMCQLFGATHVVVDSLKDAAPGLDKEEIGSAWNLARQRALEVGIQVFELHHTVKRRQDAKGVPGLADVYGSSQLTNGAGSVILLHGEPGDPIVELHHLKTIGAHSLGPCRLEHTPRGVTRIIDEPNWRKMAADGRLTASSAAALLWLTMSPSRAQLAKATRKLDSMTDIQRDSHSGNEDPRWMPAVHVPPVVKVELKPVRDWQDDAEGPYEKPVATTTRVVPASPPGGGRRVVWKGGQLINLDTGEVVEERGPRQVDAKVSPGYL